MILGQSSTRINFNLFTRQMAGYSRGGRGNRCEDLRAGSKGSRSVMWGFGLGGQG